MEQADFVYMVRMNAHASADNSRAYRRSVAASVALDRPRFLAVLAHEYGHLRGDHGRFAAWSAA